MNTLESSLASRIDPNSKEDQKSARKRSFDIDAKFRDFCGVLGLDPFEAGGKITFVGEDPILPSRHRLGACISIPMMAAAVGTATIVAECAAAADRICNWTCGRPFTASTRCSMGPGKIRQSPVRGSCKPEWKRSLEPSETNGIGGHPVKFFGQYEDEIYGAGLRGVVPKLPIDIATLEKKAVAAWSDTVASYVQGGSGDEWTQDRNVAAFRKWGLVPPMRPVDFRSVR